jgi:hypothetical protein
MPAAIAARFTKTDFVRKKERRARAARFILCAMALLMNCGARSGWSRRCQ